MNVTFLGLGAMGMPMARRVAEAGFPTTVWNRTAGRMESLRDVAALAPSAAAATVRADVVITMLADPAALRAVLLEDEQGSIVPAGATLVEMSTVGPAEVAAITARLPGDVAVVDAPVLGGVADAEAGTLRVLTGATPESFARVRELLSVFGEPVHLGPPGSGAAAKLVVNSTLAGLMALIGEALALGERLDLDRAAVLDVLLASPIGPALERKLERISSGRYDPSFRLALMHKDMTLVGDAAGGGLPVAAAVLGWLDGARAAGRGDEDYSAVVSAITDACR